jgi:hypothetical protein
MTKEGLAAQLNGREYAYEIITKDEAKEAQANGLVVVFGLSDDLMEFRGAIRDEIGAWNGTTAILTPDGLLENECSHDDCPYAAKIAAAAKSKIEAIFDSEGYAWVYKTDIPHSTFEVMEDGEKYCRGIVFSMADVV